MTAWEAAAAARDDGHAAERAHRAAAAAAAAAGPRERQEGGLLERLEHGAHDERAQVGRQAVHALLRRALRGHQHQLGALRQHQLLGRLRAV